MGCNGSFPHVTTANGSRQACNLLGLCIMHSRGSETPRARWSRLETPVRQSPFKNTKCQEDVGDNDTGAFARHEYARDILPTPAKQLDCAK